ncbi:hypothetical protein DPEC_G00363530 [Dallia pectoralis]|nr:hypothetical protein DPEC_G00363530 [Dallia pectoralis]
MSAAARSLLANGHLVRTQNLRANIYMLTRFDGIDDIQVTPSEPWPAPRHGAGEVPEQNRRTWCLAQALRPRMEAAHFAGAGACRRPCHPVSLHEYSRRRLQELAGRRGLSCRGLIERWDICTHMMEAGDEKKDDLFTFTT